MFNPVAVALVTGAIIIAAGSDRAVASDATRLSEPNVIYAAAAQPAPQRLAHGERSDLGGGFIEFLFGDRQADPRYRQPPVYQQQPDYYGRARNRSRAIRSRPCQPTRRLTRRASSPSILPMKSRKSNITAAKAPAPW